MRKIINKRDANLRCPPCFGQNRVAPNARFSIQIVDLIQNQHLIPVTIHKHLYVSWSKKWYSIIYILLYIYMLTYVVRVSQPMENGMVIPASLRVPYNGFIIHESVFMG
jgi:hypothetical protein